MWKKQLFSRKYFAQNFFSHMTALWHFVKCVSGLAPCQKSPMLLKNWARNDSSKMRLSKKYFASEIQNFFFCTVFHSFLLSQIESTSCAQQMYIRFCLRQLASEHGFLGMKIIYQFFYFWKCFKSVIFDSIFLKFGIRPLLDNIFRGHGTSHIKCHYYRCR